MSYRLPSGETTKNSRTYVRAWNRIIKPVEKVLDAKVIGFDPTLQVATKDGQGSFTLPLWAARQLARYAPADPLPPKCCVCGTIKNLHKDGWYGYRCDRADCIPF